jgi:hypothetical protein
MTRFLSESLNAAEPGFRLSLRQLEQANGHPNADIRLTSELTQATHAKVAALGLDPRDTTPKELYLAIQARLQADDSRLIKTLRTVAATHISAEGNVTAGLCHALKPLGGEVPVFAVKTSVLKRLIKKVGPKKAMKQLGYRSLDSMFKHEAACLILAAAYLVESPGWRQQFHEQYKRLQAKDFEPRTAAILHPTGGRWQTLGNSAVAKAKHNVMCFKETGTVIILPLPPDAPAGSTIASLVLALRALNDIRSSSTFLKLCQVRPDFGKVVQSVASGEPVLKANLLDHSVPWELVQRSFHRLTQSLREELLEPHIQIEDLSWHAIETALERIEPALGFWCHSDSLALPHGRQPVSLNIIDAALNLCNQLPFERRISHYFRQSLWHELLLRYLRPETVRQAVLSELQPQLAVELAIT